MEQALPFLLLIVVFYFLLIRPQRRARQQHQQLVSNVEVGDEIVTVGGMFGKITRKDDETFWLQVADGVEIRLAKPAINRKIVPEAQPVPEAPADAAREDESSPD